MISRGSSWKPTVGGTGVLIRGNRLLTSGKATIWETSSHTFRLGDQNARLDVEFRIDGKPVTFIATRKVVRQVKLPGVGYVALLELDGSSKRLPEPAIASTNYSYNPTKPVMMVGYVSKNWNASGQLERKVFKIEKENEWNALWLRFGIVFGQSPDLGTFNHNCVASASDQGAPLFDLETLHLIGLQIGGGVLAWQGISPETAVRIWSEKDLANFEATTQ